MEYYEAPNKNAFESYTAILGDLIKYKKDVTFLIILGPTATVLAYDLTVHGYRALDIGHVGKDYTFFKRGISQHDALHRHKFYAPD